MHLFKYLSLCASLQTFIDIGSSSWDAESSLEFPLFLFNQQKMVISDNNSTAADDMGRVGRHKINFVLVHPFIQFYVLSFGVMEFEAVDVDELGEEGEVGVGEMDPD